MNLKETRIIEFTNSEIAIMREGVLAKRDYLRSLYQLKKTGIEDFDELIKYTNESINKQIDEINYLCCKLG